MGSRLLELPFLRTGFRPFFWFAALAAITLIPYWLLVFVGGHELSNRFDPVSWHRHEMVFGYTAAVLAGFFLTAVPNWTDTTPVRGGPLLLLVVLWLGGRLGMTFSSMLPGGLVAAVDVLFLPVIALTILVPLWRTKNRRNLPFVPMLLVMGLCNLAIHLDLLEVWEGHSSTALQVALDLVVLIMLVIGGRVIPYFTRKALEVEIEEPGWLPHATNAAALGVAFVDLLVRPGPLMAVFCLLTATFGLIRMARWQFRETWKRPILWVLHLGYAAILIGLAVKAAAVYLQGIPARGATHFLTVGGIGILTLGMMSRVALGHTGRPLQVSRWMILAFLLMTLAAGIRALGPLIAIEYYFVSLEWAGGLWTVAFLCYLGVYTPVLFSARPDGKSG